ncbi:MAG TPA: hypothetical protein ENI82_05030, partial [Bacteroidetes bacterium]|nr:hypothetical protein [Bacteroidota bacterium]
MSWQKFEEQFKQSGETDREFDFNETAWNRMQTQLEAKKKKRRGFFWLWYLSAAVIVGGLLFYYNYSFEKEEQVLESNLITKQLLPNQNIKTKKDQSIQAEAKK